MCIAFSVNIFTILTWIALCQVGTQFPWELPVCWGNSPLADEILMLCPIVEDKGGHS